MLRFTDKHLLLDGKVVGFLAYPEKDIIQIALRGSGIFILYKNLSVVLRLDERAIYNIEDFHKLVEEEDKLKTYLVQKDSSKEYMVMLTDKGRLIRYSEEWDLRDGVSNLIDEVDGSVHNVYQLSYYIEGCAGFQYNVVDV